MLSRINPSRFWRVSALLIVICLFGASAFGQTDKEVSGAAAFLPLQNEAPAKITVDPPLAEPLALGRVVIQYRTEHLHVVPVFGPTALAVSPRIGHVHVTVDDGPWGWANASGEPVILNGLPPGPHKVLLELVNSNHQVIDHGKVQFTVPKSPNPETPAAIHTATKEPSAKILTDEPLAEPLSRGVVFIRYRTEHLQIVPVFGSAATDVSPRIGHIHVTVDNAPWHWADASGNPVIIEGLAPGPHKILIELANPVHQPMNQSTVQVTVPTAGPQHNAR
jgi:hypothetical protein